MENRKKVAMIPARLGSKRVKKKNLRLLAGKPLISYAVKACIDSEIFDAIYVNSESDEIGRVAEAMGVRWYRRVASLAGDDIKNEDFVYDFVKNVKCDYVFMINPTSPFIKKEEINAFVKEMIDGDYDSMFSVEKIKTQVFFRGKAVNFAVEQPHISSQDIEPVFAIRWAVTGWKSKTFIRTFEDREFATYCGRIGTYTLSEYSVIDIDYEEDFELAKAVMEKMDKI
jgi:CMP-N-acetylneuraminic acid synthetase